MFSEYFNKTRKAILEREPKFSAQVRRFRNPADEKLYWLDIINGKLVAYEDGSLRQLPVDNLRLPKSNQGQWVSRKIEVGDDRDYRAAMKMVEYLKMRGAGMYHGIHLFTCDGIKLYVTSGSDLGEWFRLMEEDGEEHIVPIRIFRELHYSTRKHVHPYTAEILDLKSGIVTYPPIITVSNERREHEGAYTRLVEVPGCEGVYDFLSYDVTINLSLLDQSSTPVVDLAHFIEAFCCGRDHDSKKWGIDIDKFQIQAAYNPLPFPLRKIDDELPGHRLFLNKDDINFNEGNHSYSGFLPTKFP